MVQGSLVSEPPKKCYPEDRAIVRGWVQVSTHRFIWWLMIVIIDLRVVYMYRTLTDHRMHLIWLSIYICGFWQIRIKKHSQLGDIKTYAGPPPKIRNVSVSFDGMELGMPRCSFACLLGGKQGWIGLGLLRWWLLIPSFYLTAGSHCNPKFSLYVWIVWGGISTQMRFTASLWSSMIISKKNRRTIYEYLFKGMVHPVGKGS